MFKNQLDSFVEYLRTGNLPFDFSQTIELMKIIIAGAGQVGSTLAENLANEANDVTIIDIDAERLRELQDQLDIRGITGMASHPDVLTRAGIQDADMLIAVTNSDEVNIVTCQVAYSLFHTPTKIARVRSRNYTTAKIQDKLFNEDNIPVDVLINPEQLATDYIRRLVEQPGTAELDGVTPDANPNRLVSSRPPSRGAFTSRGFLAAKKWWS